MNYDEFLERKDIVDVQSGRPMIGRMQYDRDAGVVYCVVEG